MIDWTAAAEMTPEALRVTTDLEAVADALGIEFRDGRALCPFHKDTDPSLHTFDGDDGVPRYGCLACGIAEDVFGLVKRRRGGTYSDAVAFVAAIRASGAVYVPKSSDAPNVDLDAYASSRSRHLSTIADFMRDAHLDVPESWLVDSWSVGTNDRGSILIPHYTASGVAVGVKLRHAPDWPKQNVHGSRFAAALYGAWRDRGRGTVVLCEGESDAWLVSYALRDHEDVDVLALPTGAAARPKDEWLEALQGRTVVLMLDADDAGRAGARTWASLLEDVKLAVLPEGTDAVDAGMDVVLAAYANAVELEAAPVTIEASGCGYLRPSKDEKKPPTPISDWTARVLSIAEGDEIVVTAELHNGQAITFRSEDFNTSLKMKRKMNACFLTWVGNDLDAQALLQLFRFESYYAPKVKATGILGWHDGGYVLPDESIGTAAYRYVPPMADVRAADRIRLSPGEWDRTVPRYLTDLHAPEVVKPILGWLGAAPLRATLPQFPILAVVGGSGWGKTTLVGELMATFGFSTSPMTLTATTPHAVASLVASTNAIPVWIDEYRFGARQDARERLDQAIRDAWDGSSSVKGGMQANLQALTYSPAIAPLLVTGEDAFSETSHAERMVIIPIPRDGRNPAALSRLRELPRSGFGRSYLEWIVRSHRSGTIPPAPVHLERMLQARAIAEWGWQLLRFFTLEECGYDLGDYDGSLVEREHREMAARSPYLEALREMLDRTGPDGYPIVWREGEDVCVRTLHLTDEIKKRTDLVLPGGSRAARKWYDARFQVREDRNSSGRFIRLRGATSEVVGD